MIRKGLATLYGFLESKLQTLLEWLANHSLLFSLLALLSKHIPLVMGVGLVLCSVIPDSLWSNIYLLLMAFGLWILGLINREDNAKRPFEDFFVLFMITIVLATVFSIHPALSLPYGLIYGAVFVIFSVFINQIRSWEDLSKVVIALAFAALMVSVYGILQKHVIGVSVNLSQTDISISQELSGRVYSTLGNPNILGEFYLLVLPLVCGLFLVHDSKIVKALAAMTLLLSLYVLLATGSRSAWGSFAFAMAVFIALYKPRLLPIFLMMGLISFFFMPQTIQVRVMSIFNKNDSSLGYRRMIYEAASLMKGDYQWVGGVGLGGDIFQKVFESYKVNELSTVAHSHNLYLQLAIEAGMFSVIFLLSYVAKIVLKALSSFAQNKSGKEGKIKILQIACIASLAGFFLMSFVDYTWFYFRIVVLFFAVVGILSNLNNVKAQSDKAE
ncbi:O-antigen ligase family protein [Aedoeadaptatus urinae]|uniref:O-antigen ligase family protein n=1 Tax=Aedoeadaptatus urinae TaxID=1871017 RepID=UPI0013567233|nr:O-antigen ligase family protein [Peptoniphilus urinae]